MRGMLPSLVILLLALGLGDVALAQYDPTSVQPFFIIRPADSKEFTQVYTDQGGNAGGNLAVWNFTNSITPLVDFRPFGTYACGRTDRNLENCLSDRPVYVGAIGVNVSSQGGAPLGIPASNFQKIWDDSNSGAFDYGSIWNPYGDYAYSNVGDWMMGGSGSSVWNTPPPAGQPWLVNNMVTSPAKCLVPCPTSRTKIWTNQGDDKKDEDITIYMVGGSKPGSNMPLNTALDLGTDSAQTNYSAPDSYQCLASQCVSFIQLNIAKVISYTLDWKKATNKQSTNIVAGASQYDNPTNKDQTEEFKASASVTSSNTLTLEQSMGFSKTISYEESIEIEAGIPDFNVKTTGTFDQEYSFSNSFDQSQSVSDTIEEDLQIDQTITVPKHTILQANWTLAQAKNVQVPVTLVVQYQAVDYSNGGQLVTNSQTVKDFLTATGFAGTFGTWNTQNSTLTTTVKANLTVNSVWDSDMVLYCIPKKGYKCPRRMRINNVYVPGQPKKRSSTLASIDANSDASSVANSDADNVNPAQTDEGTGVPMIYEFKYRQHMKKMKPALIKRKRTDISQICYPDWRSTKKVDEATRKKVCGW